MDTPTTLTVAELKPGYLYQVVDAGGRSASRHLLTVVLGASPMCAHRAVTVRAAPGMEAHQRLALGTLWDHEDTDARFLPHVAPVVLANPS